MTRISNDRPFLAGEVEVLRATEKAIQVRSLRKEKTEWVPQSCVHDDSEVWKAGDKGKLIVKMWFAEAQGWVDGKPAPAEERVTRWDLARAYGVQWADVEERVRRHMRGVR